MPLLVASCTSYANNFLLQSRCLSCCIRAEDDFLFWMYETSIAQGSNILKKTASREGFMYGRVYFISQDIVRNIWTQGYWKVRNDTRSTSSISAPPSTGRVNPGLKTCTEFTTLSSLRKTFSWKWRVLSWASVHSSMFAHLPANVRYSHAIARLQCMVLTDHRTQLYSSLYSRMSNTLLDVGQRSDALLEECNTGARLVRIC